MYCHLTGLCSHQEFSKEQQRRSCWKVSLPGLEEDGIGDLSRKGYRVCLEYPQISNVPHLWESTTVSKWERNWIGFLLGAYQDTTVTSLSSKCPIKTRQQPSGSLIFTRRVKGLANGMLQGCLCVWFQVKKKKGLTKKSPQNWSLKREWNKRQNP